MVNVNFNMENIQRCLCPGCPVQAKSECVQDKPNKLIPKGGNPSKEDVLEFIVPTENPPARV